MADGAHAFALGGRGQGVVQGGALVAILPAGETHLGQLAPRQFMVELGRDTGRRAFATDPQGIRQSLAQTAQPGSLSTTKRRGRHGPKA